MARRKNSRSGWSETINVSLPAETVKLLDRIAAHFGRINSDEVRATRSFAVKELVGNFWDSEGEAVAYAEKVEARREARRAQKTRPTEET